MKILPALISSVSINTEPPIFDVNKISPPSTAPVPLSTITSPPIGYAKS